MAAWSPSICSGPHTCPQLSFAIRLKRVESPYFAGNLPPCLPGSSCMKLAERRPRRRAGQHAGTAGPGQDAARLASQPFLRTISLGKFPGRVRGPAPPLVSQAPLPCPAPQAILRAGRPDCEGCWPRTGRDWATSRAGGTFAPGGGQRAALMLRFWKRRSSKARPGSRRGTSGLWDRAACSAGRPDVSWHDRAACRGVDALLFSGPAGEARPGREIREAKAKAVCRLWPVRVRCLGC